MSISRLGFMQGRLSPLVDGRIQAFPRATWREEFPAAQQLGFALMEWTLDSEGLDQNPLISDQAEVNTLQRRFGVRIPSVTCDALMQVPPHRVGPSGFEAATGIALPRLIERFGAAGAVIAVVPLVDNGAIQTPHERGAAIKTYLNLEDDLKKADVRIAFELDLRPEDAATFIAAFPAERYGINYDIGNSASLGYDPKAEFDVYGARVINVHVKDRALGGTTVPLGSGAADFAAVAEGLTGWNYGGNYILQTARAADGRHGAALLEFREFASRFGWS